MSASRRYSHVFPSMVPVILPPIQTPSSGTSIGGFTIVYRSAHVMRVGAYCVIGPGAVVRDGASIGHRCYVGAEAVIGRGARAAGCVVAPGCGTVAELGVMVLDQPRLGIARWGTLPWWVLERVRRLRGQHGREGGSCRGGGGGRGRPSRRGRVFWWSYRGKDRQGCLMGVWGGLGGGPGGAGVMDENGSSDAVKLKVYK